MNALLRTALVGFALVLGCNTYDDEYEQCVDAGRCTDDAGVHGTGGGGVAETGGGGGGGTGGGGAPGAGGGGGTPGTGGGGTPGTGGGGTPGTGGGAQFLFNPDSLDAGILPVGTSADSISYLENHSGGYLTFSADAGAYGEFRVTPLCPPDLSAGASCLWRFSFSPSHPIETVRTFTVASKEGPVATITLKGRGVNTAFTVFPTSLTFDAGAASYAQVRVWYTGSVIATILDTYEGPNATAFSRFSSDCDRPLLASDGGVSSCSVFVAFFGGPVDGGPVDGGEGDGRVCSATLRLTPVTSYGNGPSVLVPLEAR